MYRRIIENYEYHQKLEDVIYEATNMSMKRKTVRSNELSYVYYKGSKISPQIQDSMWALKDGTVVKVIRLMVSGDGKSCQIYCKSTPELRSLFVMDIDELFSGQLGAFHWEGTLLDDEHVVSCADLKNKFFPVPLNLQCNDFALMAMDNLDSFGEKSL
jgi:hypothetical protein